MITAGPSMVPNIPVVPGMQPAQQFPPGYQMPPGYMWQEQINTEYQTKVARPYISKAFLYSRRPSAYSK